MNESRTHFKTPAKRSNRGLILFAIVVVTLVNLELTHFDRSEFGAFSPRYIFKMFDPVGFVPLLEVYALFHLLDYLRERVESWPIIYAFPSAFLGFCMVEGHYFETKNAVDFLSPEKFFVLLCALAAIGFAIVYYLSFVAFELFFERLVDEDFEVFEKLHANRLVRLIERHPFLVTLVFLTAVAVPLLYISYPSLFMGDTRRQILQALGVHQLYNKHPILHTLLIRYCLRIGVKFFGSYNLGIWLTTVIQNLIFIPAVAFSVYTLVKTEKAPGYVAFLVPLILVLHPRCIVFFFLITKDTIYCAFLLLFFCFTLRIVHDQASRFNTVAWIALAVATGLFRRDGLYVIIPSAAALALFYRPLRVRVPALLAVVLVFFALWYRVVLPYKNVLQGSPRVKYSVAFQATARYLREHPDDVTPEEYAAIDDVLDAEELPRVYDPSTADNVIATYQDDTTKEQLATFFEAWLSMFKRHPDSMLRGIFNFKYRWFYPSDNQAHLYNIYNGDKYIQQTNEQSGFTDFSMDEPQHTLLSTFINTLEAIIRLPMIGVFFTPYAVDLLACFLLCYALRKHMGRELAFLLMLALQLAINIAGPVNGGYYRYSFPSLLSLPFYFTLMSNRMRGIVLPALPAQQDVPASSTQDVGVEEDAPAQDAEAVL